MPKGGKGRKAEKTGFCIVARRRRRKRRRGKKSFLESMEKGLEVKKNEGIWLQTLPPKKKKKLRAPCVDFFVDIFWGMEEALLRNAGTFFFFQAPGKRASFSGKSVRVCMPLSKL